MTREDAVEIQATRQRAYEELRKFLDLEDGSGQDDCTRAFRSALTLLELYHYTGLALESGGADSELLERQLLAVRAENDRCQKALSQIREEVMQLGRDMGLSLDLLPTVDAVRRCQERVAMLGIHRFIDGSDRSTPPPCPSPSAREREPARTVDEKTQEWLSRIPPGYMVTLPDSSPNGESVRTVVENTTLARWDAVALEVGKALGIRLTAESLEPGALIGAASEQLLGAAAEINDRLAEYRRFVYGLADTLDTSLPDSFEDVPFHSYADRIAALCALLKENEDLKWELAQAVRLFGPLPALLRQGRGGESDV